MLQYFCRDQSTFNSGALADGRPARRAPLSWLAYDVAQEMFGERIRRRVTSGILASPDTSCKRSEVSL